MAAVGRHRAEVRPRYGRLSVLGASVAVIGVALLGGTGIIPVAADTEASDTSGPGSAAVATKDAGDTAELMARDIGPEALEPEKEKSEPAPPDNNTQTETPDEASAPEPAMKRRDKSLPAKSGVGRRVVFSESRQRVWLMSADRDVERTYLVSGSIYENLEPGKFEVFSRSENAYGIDDSGTMKYFVRFTRGPSGAAIGFHDIPVKDGDRLQGFDQLGTPLSHGCVRQKRSDAIALWDFAPIGTKVVVTA